MKDFESFNKEVSDLYPSFRKLLEAYPLFFDQNDSLRSFLDAGADKILLKIDDMEGHRRALKAVSVEGVSTNYSKYDFLENLVHHDYKVFVLYYPGTFRNREFEAKLHKLEDSLGKNLFIRIGRANDPDYNRISKLFGITKLPVIIVTGTEDIASLKRDTATSTLYVRIDDVNLLDPDNTIKVIERLYNHFLSGRLAEELHSRRDESNLVLSYIKNNIIDIFKGIKEFISEKDVTISVIDGKFELRRKD